MRRTKIIGTIGPASSSEEVFAEMCKAGLNVARLNFSHGTHEEHQQKFDMIHKVRKALGLPIAIMLDTKGPEYRIGTFEGGKITLDVGDTFTFTTEPVTGSSERVSVSYPGLARDLEAGSPWATRYWSTTACSPLRSKRSQRPTPCARSQRAASCPTARA